MQKKKFVTMTLTLCLIIGLFSAVFVMAAEGVFTIKKVDQNNEPLKDVEFEVYGKPVLEVERPVVIQKLHSTNRFSGPLVEKVTIHIEGEEVDESFTASREKNYLEITLKPGTYKFYEEVPEFDKDFIMEQNVTHTWQHFLTSGEFTIKEDGSIKKGNMKWGKLSEEIDHEQRCFMDDIDVSGAESDVKITGNLITIINETGMVQYESQVQE